MIYRRRCRRCRRCRRRRCRRRRCRRCRRCRHRRVVVVEKYRKCLLMIFYIYDTMCHFK
jgi:hypothetical protein